MGTTFSVNNSGDWICLSQEIGNYVVFLQENGFLSIQISREEIGGSISKEIG